MAILGRCSSGAIPLTTSLIVPSPPAATTRSKPSSATLHASLVAFMIWPTRKPTARSFPFLKSSTDCWLLSKISLMIGSSLFGSDNCTQPLFSTTSWASPPFVINSRKTFLAIFELIVPSAIKRIIPAKFSGVNFVSANSSFSLFK